MSIFNFFKKIKHDMSLIFIDFYYFYFGYYNTFSIKNFKVIFFLKLTKINDLRKYFLKKHIYTINHKRIALNYFYFSMWTGWSGALLATMIRLELAYPGSTFFQGDSIRYLQVITAHGLIMVFFVAVPIIFGGFANFFIPYHIGSKDVAYPRLNSIAFWILPNGYLLLAKTAFFRPDFWRYYDKIRYLEDCLDTEVADKFFSTDFSYFLESKWQYTLQKNLVNNFDKKFIQFHKLKDKFEYSKDYLEKCKQDPSYENKDFNKNIDLWNWNNFKMHMQWHLSQYSGSLWYLCSKFTKKRRKKVFFTKCSNRTLTMTGWTFIAPFSSKTKYSGIGSQDIAIVSVIFAGVSTTIGFTNLLITRRTLSMPGLRNRRVLLPFLSISLFLTMRMLALITPVLAAAMIMLLMDRHWNTTFFEFNYGGDSILFAHLFWFFGHPEVYVLVIPVFGIINMVIPYSNTRRVASKHHMIWAVYMMAYMGFIVWGHHMYLVGLDHRSRALYSTVTVMISLPATVKIVNWTMSLLNGGLKWDVSLLFAFAFIIFFLGGGLTGMWLSHVALNISMHDTFYVVAHFHLMFSAVVFTGIFSGIYYYFPALFGIKYSRTFAYFHLIYFVGGQWLTFLPMFWLGYSGMPRRVHDYPAFMMGWHGMASVGHLITMLGVVFFFCMLVDSHFEKKIFICKNLGLPRWNKRLQYYFYKIRLLQLNKKKTQLIGNFKFIKISNNKISVIGYFEEYDIIS